MDSDDALEHTVAADSYNGLVHRDDVDADAEVQPVVVSPPTEKKWQQPVVLPIHSEHIQVHSHYWHQ